MTAPFKLDTTAYSSDPRDWLTGKLPRVDNTMIQMYQTCPRKFWYQQGLGWQPKEPNIHLEFGTALHKAMAGDVPGALEYLDSFEDVWTKHKNKDSLQWCVESARLPGTLLEREKYTEHPLGKGLYCGTLDALTQDDAGDLWIVDYKTTGRSKGPQVWELSPQFMGYQWLAQHERPITGNLVMEFAVESRTVNLYPVVYPFHVLVAWYGTVLDTIDEMLRSAPNARPHFGESCNMYGGCQFREACLSDNPAHWATMFTTERRWDPRPKA